MAEVIKSGDLNKPKPNQPQQLGGVQQAPKRQGSGFTNLQRVLQANSNNKLGQTIGQNIQQTGIQAQQGLTQATQNLRQGAEANRLDTQANIQARQNILADPTKANEQDITQFAKFREGAYLGPRELANADVLKAKASQAEGLGQATTTQGGRQALLQRYAGGNQYSGGQQRLDELLLGKTGANQLKQARQATAGLGNQAIQQELSGQQIGQEYANKAQQFAKDTISGIEGIRNPLNQSIESKLKSAEEEEKNRQTNFEKIQQLLTGEVPDESAAVRQAYQLAKESGAIQNDDVAGFFEDPNQIASQLKYGRSIAGTGAPKVDFRNFLSKYLTTQQAENVSKVGLTSKEDAAKLNALAKLQGIETPYSEAQEGLGTYKAGQLKAGLNRQALDEFNAEVARQSEAYWSTPIEVRIPGTNIPIMVRRDQARNYGYDTNKYGLF